MLQHQNAVAYLIINKANKLQGETGNDVSKKRGCFPFEQNIYAYE